MHSVQKVQNIRLAVTTGRWIWAGLAIAGPCARVPGRVLEPRNVKHLSSTCGVGPLGQQQATALRSFDILSLAVGKPGLSCQPRNWGFEQCLADHP